jgi:hypothetical protein
MAFQETTFWDAPHFAHILHALTFHIHGNKAIFHKDIWFRNILTMCSWTHLPSSSSNYAGTSIQHPHESNRVWPHSFLLHLSK